MISFHNIYNLLTDGTPLGLESKYIPDSRFSASSAWNKQPLSWPWRARLNLALETEGGQTLSGAWASAANITNEWIQVILHGRVSNEGPGCR